MRRVVSAAVAVIFSITILGLAAPDPGPAAAAVPGTVVVDELSGGFTPTGYGWRGGATGYGGHHYWARASRRAHLTGIWRASLEPGRYRVLAWLPRQHATTRKAVYKVKSADGWAKRVRNQYQQRGGWVSLGTHRFAGRAEVRLQDKTRDPKGTRRTLAFDAIRFVPLAAPAPPPTPTPTPTLPPEPTPTPEPTSTPVPPVIRNIDVEPRADRLIVRFSLDAPGPARTEYREARAVKWLVGADETSSTYQDHRQVIRGLPPLTAYEVRVIATNDGGKTVSDIVRATTLAPPPPVIRDLRVAPAEFRAVVTFSLDAKGPARTEYREAGTSEWLAGPNETSSQYQDHRQVITGLRPQTRYELRVIATNDGGRTTSDIVPFKTKVRTVDCDQGESLGNAIASAKDGDTLMVKGICNGQGVPTVDKDLTLRGSDSAVVFQAITAAAGATVTVDGITQAFTGGGTNRGRLTLIDSPVDVACGRYENAPGAVLTLVRSGLGNYDLLANAGVFEATDTALRGGCTSPEGIDNRASGSMTLRRTSIAGDVYVLGNAGSAVLDRASMEGVNGKWASPIRNSGTMTIRSSRFIDNSGNPASVVLNSGTLTVVESLFRGNNHLAAVAPYDEAAAIVNRGDITLRDNTFIDNIPADCRGC